MHLMVGKLLSPVHQVHGKEDDKCTLQWVTLVSPIYEVHEKEDSGNTFLQVTLVNSVYEVHGKKIYKCTLLIVGKTCQSDWEIVIG